MKDYKEVTSDGVVLINGFVNQMNKPENTPEQIAAWAAMIQGRANYIEKYMRRVRSYNLDNMRNFPPINFIYE